MTTPTTFNAKEVLCVELEQLCPDGHGGAKAKIIALKMKMKAKGVNEAFPQQVIQWYEQHIVWQDQ